MFKKSRRWAAWILNNFRLEGSENGNLFGSMYIVYSFIVYHLWKKKEQKEATSEEAKRAGKRFRTCAKHCLLKSLSGYIKCFCLQYPPRRSFFDLLCAFPFPFFFFLHSSFLPFIPSVLRCFGVSFLETCFPLLISCFITLLLRSFLPSYL